MFAGDLVSVDMDRGIYLAQFDDHLPAAAEGWEYHSTNQGRIQIVDQRMQMDAARYGYSLNEAILHLDLAGLSGVQLTFDHDSISDENATMPASFEGHHNSDGVAISEDGVTWHRLTTLRGDFSGQTFNLDEAIAAAGIQYTSDFQIKFQQYDNYYAKLDGRAFDNVLVEVIPDDSLNSPTEVLYQDSLTSIDSQRWSLSSTADGRIQNVSGTLRMDSARYGRYARNEAVLHLDLAGRTGVKLKFDHDNTADENHLMPPTFTGSHNSDGIAISEDGITWHRLTALDGDFNGREFNLDRAIAMAGISYSHDFQIKFQQYDNYPSPIDGRAFDNIVVTADQTNHKPEAVTDSYIIDEDNRLVASESQGVLINDIDTDGDPISAAIHFPAEHGQLLLNPDGSFEYLPDPNWFGVDRFSYIAFDGMSWSDPVDVLIDVRPVNDAPTNLTLSNHSVLASAGATIGQLSVDDPDIHDVRHTFQLSDGRFEVIDGWLKLKDFVELDARFEPKITMTLEAFDASGQSVHESFSIDVESPTDQWRYTIQQGATRRFDFTNPNPLADRDWMLPVTTAKLTRIEAKIVGPPGASPANLLITQPSQESSWINSVRPSVATATFGPSLNFVNFPGLGGVRETNGELRIIANPTFLGSFEVEITLHYQDGNDVQTHSVNPAFQSVSHVMQFGVVPGTSNTSGAIPDRYVSDEDSAFAVPANSGVTANDIAASSKPKVQLVSATEHGKLQLLPDGSFNYRPVANFNGVDRFVYEAIGAGESLGRAVVEIQVRAVNDSPSSWEDVYETEEDSPLIVSAASGLLENDEDIDGDLMTVQLVDSPSHGIVVVSDDGSFTYTPNADFHGVDEFTYRSTDSQLSSEPTRVTLIVTPSNDAPTAKGETFEVIEDSQFILPASILANDSDVDADLLTARLVEGPRHGTLELEENGNALYAPQANYHGSDHFAYVVSDGILQSPPVTATINVLPANDRPTPSPDQYYVDGSSLEIAVDRGVLMNDHDIDGDQLQAEIAQAPAHGSVQINSNGSFTYTPKPGFQGTDSFIYVTQDGNGGKDYASVMLDVGVWGSISAGISNVLGEWSNEILNQIKPAWNDPVARIKNTIDTLGLGINQLFTQNLIFSGKAIELIRGIASELGSHAFSTPTDLRDFVTNEVSNRLSNPSSYGLAFSQFPDGITSKTKSLIQQIQSLPIPNASEIQGQIISEVASHLNDMANRVQSVLDNLSNSLSSIGQTIDRVIGLTNRPSDHVDYAKRNAAFEQDGSYVDERWSSLMKLASGPVKDLHKMRSQVDLGAQKAFDSLQEAAQTAIRRVDRDFETAKAGLELKYPEVFGVRPPQYDIELATAETVAKTTRSAIQQTLEVELKNWAVKTVADKIREQLGSIKSRLESSAKSAAEYVNPWSLGQSFLPSLKTGLSTWIADNPLDEFRRNLIANWQRISGVYDSNTQGFRGGFIGELKSFQDQIATNQLTAVPVSIVNGMNDLEQVVKGMSWPQTSIYGNNLPSLPTGFAQAVPELRKDIGGIVTFNRSITGLSSEILDPDTINPWDDYRDQTRTVPSPPGVPNYVIGWMQGRVDAAFAELDRQGIIAGKQTTKWMKSVHDFIDLRQQEMQDVIDWVVDRHHEGLDAAGKAIDHLRGIDWEDWRSLDGWYAEVGGTSVRISKIGEDPTYEITFHLWGNTHDLSKVFVTVNGSDRYEFEPNGEKHVSLRLPLKSNGVDHFVVETLQDGKIRRREEYKKTFPIFVRYDAVDEYDQIADQHPDVSFDNGAIRIEGTDQDDQIEITTEGDSIVVSMSLRDQIQKRKFRSDQVTRIEFNGNHGNDSLINRTHLPLVARGGPGRDTIHGGSGKNEIHAEWAYGGEKDDELTGTHLYGNGGNDTLHGTSGDDQLFGGSGNDWIDGAGGNDFIDGGLDNDIIFTDWSALQAMTNDALALTGRPNGKATVFGGQGNDELYGGEHSGFLVGGPGTDIMRGTQVRLIGGNASLPEGTVPIEQLVPDVSDQNLAEFVDLRNQLEDVDQQIKEQQNLIRSLGGRIDQIKEKGLIADDYVRRAEYLFKTASNLRKLSVEIAMLTLPTKKLTYLTNLKKGLEVFDTAKTIWDLLSDTGERAVRELRPLSDLWNTTREMERESRTLAALCEVRLELLEARNMLSDEADDLGSGTDAMKQFTQEVLDIQTQIEEKNRRSLLASHLDRVHIGDDKFEKASQNAGDFQEESIGKEWTWEFQLNASQIAEIANQEWRSVELTGQVIGLDNIEIGTRVTVNGSTVNSIKTPDGEFRIPIRKRFLREGTNKIRFVAKLGNKGFDDSEMWGFELRLVD